MFLNISQLGQFLLILMKAMVLLLPLKFMAISLRPETRLLLNII